MLSKSLLFISIFALVIHLTLVAFIVVLGASESIILSAWKSFVAILAIISASSGRWIKVTTILAGGTVAAIAQLQWRSDLPGFVVNAVIPQIGPFISAVLSAKNFDEVFGLIFGTSLLFGDVLLSVLDITASVALFGFLLRALLLHRSARATVNNKAAAVTKKKTN